MPQASLSDGDAEDHDDGADRLVPQQDLGQQGYAEHDPDQRGQVGHGRGRRGAPARHDVGAPANLAAHGLDVRLSALVGGWGGTYTRYADDLALSTPRHWGSGLGRLLAAVEEVVRDEGFRLHERKTAVQPGAGRQVLGGLVVNERPRVARQEVDALRAMLHNCAVHGPGTQDREGRGDLRGHLVGRVGWVAQHDPVRGARLRAQLDAVDWDR